MTELRYPADLYEAVHIGTPGDLAFYQRVTEGASSVLELGCGYGRVLSALDAPTLVGVDSDPGLLRAARIRLAGRAVFELADVRTLDLETRFDCVIAPYSTLYCFTTDEDLAAALRAARAHLAPAGVFALDVWRADEFHEEADPDETPRFERIADVVARGVRYVVEERTEWDENAQILVVDYRHTPGDGSDRRDGRIVHRYMLEEQLISALDAAGLAVVETERAETDAGESLSVVARAK